MNSPRYSPSTKLLLALLAASLGACGTDDDNNGGGDGPEELPEVIDADRALTDIIADPTQPDYIAPQSVSVEAKLTIEPGVVVAFARDTRLTIAGRSGGVLVSQGSDEAPVRLTGEDATKGSWHGVYVDNSTSSLNELDHTIIEFGGGAEFGSGLGAANLGIGGFVGSSTFIITNSTFRDSAGHGVELEESDVLTEFSGNTFSGNDDYALSMPVEQLGVVDATTSFEGEGDLAGVEVFGGNMLEEASWKALADGAPVSVTGDVSIGARLEIEPGALLQFGDNVGVTIAGRDGGVLVARGTAEQNIVMTRLGGVTWKGLYVDNVESSENAMEHVTMEYGGFTEFEGEQALLTIGGFVGTSTMSVTSCTFRHSAGAGIYLEREVTVNGDIDTANTFEDNAGGAIVRQE